MMCEMSVEIKVLAKANQPNGINYEIITDDQGC